MNTIAKQIIEFYTKFNKEPELTDLNIEDTSLLTRTWNIFVTIYLKGEISWSSWNIKEIEVNIVNEVIKNTMNAISKDPRFEPIKTEDLPSLKVRVDEITSRRVLKKWEIDTLEPVREWVIAIQKDYDSLAVILPNISPLLLKWSDFTKALTNKLWITELKEEEYIIYWISTTIYKDF